MWIWNDFLLPYLVLDLNKYKTISIAIQYMKGSYGRVDMGAVMAALILAVIPVIIFYLSCQKHIIRVWQQEPLKGRYMPEKRSLYHETKWNFNAGIVHFLVHTESDHFKGSL